MYSNVCAEKDWNDYRIDSRVIVTLPLEIESESKCNLQETKCCTSDHSVEDEDRVL